jgi:hypothetical protein
VIYLSTPQPPKLNHLLAKTHIDLQAILERKGDAVLGVDEEGVTMSTDQQTNRCKKLKPPHL